MRLDDYDNNIDVGYAGSSGGGFGGFPVSGGGIGCGGLALILIASLIFGVDPVRLLGGQASGPLIEQSSPATITGGQQSVGDVCNADPSYREMCNGLSSLDRTWRQIFQTSGGDFQPAGLRFYSQQGVSGCGAAQSAMGPFYCPADRKIYLDTSFFEELAQMSRTRGNFARYYVIAHEYGHHIQTVTGISQQVDDAQRRTDRATANALSVRLELQADCYAGIWAAKNRDRIEPGDMQEGLRTASAIGDDILMRNAGRRVSPESFTHGSSQQRMEWLNRGLQSGDPNVCDTFQG